MQRVGYGLAWRFLGVAWVVSALSISRGVGRVRRCEPQRKQSRRNKWAIIFGAAKQGRRESWGKDFQSVG